MLAARRRLLTPERLGIVALAGLVALAVAYLLTVEPAPTVGVRWRDDVSTGRQADLERAYLLVDGRSPNPDLPRSVAYTLLDTGRRNIEALVEDPEIADTQFIDRQGYLITSDAEMSGRRIWVAHRLPGLRRAMVRWTVAAMLAATVTVGLRTQLAAFARLVVAMVLAFLATAGRTGTKVRLAAPAVGAAVMQLIPVRLREVPFIKGALSPAGPDDRDWFDACFDRTSAVAVPPSHFSCAAKLIVASAILVAIGLPILATWKALLLTACLLGLIFGVWKPQLWRIAVAVVIALCTVGIKSSLPRADIAEGHNAFMVIGDGEALQRGLPPKIFQSWKAQFDVLYPPDPVRDAAPAQWRSTPSENVPTEVFAPSADAIWRKAKYSRQVDTIDFRTLGEFRGGFANESELHGVRHTTRYNFYAGPLERKDMPFYVMYELTRASVGSRLTWKGQAFWQRGNGNPEEIVHQQVATRMIAPEDTRTRVYAAFFPARDRELQFAMEPSLLLRMGAWADTVLTLLASIGTLMLTTRLRWSAYVRALAILAAGYVVLVTHADFRVDHLGWGYSPHGGGDDGLVHEGWGRMMAMLLREGQIGEALRGAESVYWFTPGMRYVRMVEKLVFGDTNHLHTLAIALVPLVFFYLLRSFLRPAAAWMVTGAFCLVHVGNLGFLEYVAWGKAGYGESVGAVLFLLGLTLMLRARPRGDGRAQNLAIVWVAGAALAASMFIRPNFAIAIAWLGAVYAWYGLRARDVASVAALACGLGLALWMPFHNWYYGGELYLISRSVENVALTIGAADYVSAFRDAISGRLDTHAVALTSAQLRGWLWGDAQQPWERVAHVVRLLALAVTGRVALRAMLARTSPHYTALGVVAGAALLAHVPMLFVHATLNRYAMLGWDLSIVVLICAYPVEAALFVKRHNMFVPDNHEIAAHSRS